MQKINKNEMKKIIKAASLYTTGGGISIEGQYRSISKLKNDAFVEIKNANEFDKSDYVTTVCGLGPTTKDGDDLSCVKKMINILEKISSNKISGVYPVELGQESNIMVSAINANLPIVDFESSGIRAVPCADVSVFKLLNLDYSFSPLVIYTSKKECISIHNKISPERGETILRNISAMDKGTIVMVSEMVKIETIIKNDIANNPFTLMQKVSNMNFDEFISFENVKEVFEAKITKIEEKYSNGFLIKYVDFVSKNKKYQIVLQNEAMFLLDENKNVIYSVPDRICLINKNKMQGIWAGDLQKGIDFSIVILHPDKIWRQNIKKAKKLFGPQRFEKII